MCGVVSCVCNGVIWCCAQVMATQGQTVKAGDGLLVMEAMKMEHVIEAPCAG